MENTTQRIISGRKLKDLSLGRQPEHMPLGYVLKDTTKRSVSGKTLERSVSGGNYAKICHAEDSTNLFRGRLHRVCLWDDSTKVCLLEDSSKAKWSRQQHDMSLGCLWEDNKDMQASGKTAKICLWASMGRQ